MGWVAILAGMLILAMLASGCSTPQAVIDAQRESDVLVSEYASGADRAVAGLLGAYLDASLRELQATTELALLEELRTYEVVVGQTEDEEGRVAYETAIQEAIPADVAQEASRLTAERVVLIYAEIEKFRDAWGESGRNLDDAVTLRRRIREYLMAGGVQAEHVDALADALARRLKER